MSLKVVVVVVVVLVLVVLVLIMACTLVQDVRTVYRDVLEVNVPLWCKMCSMRYNLRSMYLYVLPQLYCTVYTATLRCIVALLCGFSQTTLGYLVCSYVAKYGTKSNSKTL